MRTHAFTHAHLTHTRDFSTGVVCKCSVPGQEGVCPRLRSTSEAGFSITLRILEHLIGENPQTLFQKIDHCNILYAPLRWFFDLREKE